jgi:hypothetical protein
MRRFLSTRRILDPKSRVGKRLPFVPAGSTINEPEQ